jgi:hypothetical protein
MNTDTTVITITVPSAWLEGLDENDLRTALHLGLAQIRQQRDDPARTNQVIQVLRNTGRIHHLSTSAPEPPDRARQPPPALPGMPVSEILIAQRRGEV